MDTEERKGDWFQTHSGGKFYVFDPKPEDVLLEDIAHSLSLLCRFGGHTREFYSVAQHSAYVAHIFSKLAKGTSFETSREAHLCALLHDATEAYMGDMIRPIKRSLPEYKKAENEVWACILEHFGLDMWCVPLKDMIKEADEIVLVTERRDLLNDGPGRNRHEWRIEERADPDPEVIKPWSPQKAKEKFLTLFEKLS